MEVRIEDQQRINTFGRLNTRMKELEAELKEKRGLYDQYDDAANEILLADDDEPIRYQFGECFFETDKDSADELLEKQKEKVEAEAAQIEGELAAIKSTLATLKAELYRRFGKNINLEE